MIVLFSKIIKVDLTILFDLYYLVYYINTYNQFLKDCKDYNEFERLRNFVIETIYNSRNLIGVFLYRIVLR